MNITAEILYALDDKYGWDLDIVSSYGEPFDRRIAHEIEAAWKEAGV